MKNIEIFNRFKEKYKDVSFEEEDLKMLEDDLASQGDITHIIFEDYNFPDLNWRCYTKRDKIKSYLEIIVDYFSDIEYSLLDLPEDFGAIYDIAKDKFFNIEIKISTQIKEI